MEVFSSGENVNEYEIKLVDSHKDLTREQLEYLLFALQEIVTTCGGDLSLWKSMRFAFAREVNVTTCGVLAYDPKYDADGMLWIQIAYVDEANRGEGLFGKMLAAIRAVHSSGKIGIATNTDNETALKAFRRAGFVESVRYLYLESERG
mgnify:CR=1 FL=1